MFADGGTELPAAVRTNAPGDVARAVVRAIEANRGEVYVAPLEMRTVATLAGAVPGISERLQRRLGVAERRRAAGRGGA
jgi:hypothetical protein